MRSLLRTIGATFAVLVLVAEPRPAFGFLSAGITPDSPDGRAALHFMMARMLAGEGRSEEAVSEFESALALDGEDFVILLEYASALETVGRGEEAVAALKKARAVAPDEPTVHRRLGEVLIQRGFRGRGQDGDSLEQGLAALEELRRIDPADLPGMALLAQAYRRLGRTDDAVATLEALVRFHTDNLQLKQLLVDTLQGAGRKDRAGEVLREMMLLEQSTPESQLELAKIEADRQNFSAAIELVERLIDGGSQEPVALEFLADLLIARSMSKEATEPERASDRSRAAEISRSLPDERRVPTEVRLALAEGRPQEAITLLRKIAETSRDPADSLNLVDLLARTDRVEEGLAALEAAIRRFADDPQKARMLTVRQVQILAREARWEAAAAAAERLVATSTGPQRSQALLWQIEALQRAAKWDRAIALIRGERKAEPTSAEWALREVELLSERGRPKEARRILERKPLSGEVEPPLWLRVCRQWYLLGDEKVARSFVDAYARTDGFERLFAAGRCLSGVERFDQAVGFLSQSAERVETGSEGEAEVRFWLGQAHERGGDFESAAREFERVLQTRQNDATTMNYLGYMWAEQGLNLERALELIERAVAIEPGNGSYLDSLGWAQFRLGRFEEARRSLQQAVDLSPGNAVILEHLGDVFSALGKVTDATRAYERALELRDNENETQVEAKLRALRTSAQDG